MAKATSVDRPNVRQHLGIPVKKRRRTRKASNAGGKSKWMREFFSRPSPPVWKTVKPWKGEAAE